MAARFWVGDACYHESVTAPTRDLPAIPLICGRSHAGDDDSGRRRAFVTAAGHGEAHP